MALAALASAARASAVGAPSLPLEPHFVAMPAIVVPIIGSDRIEGSLRFKLVLAANDSASLERLTARLPELRAVSVAGAIEFSRLFASPQTAVDARRLSADLTAALCAEDPGIARVLIVEVSAES
ncbi:MULTISPECIES: hypothetical protein [Sphingomonas]|uniref:hypothetical protein n=1 Tax=Sphingomonas TaxID=13687 RepID=UPI0024134A5C|nr:hypothetical protein [Sphingomonas echinoides]